MKNPAARKKWSSPRVFLIGAEPGTKGFGPGTSFTNTEVQGTAMDNTKVTILTEARVGTQSNGPGIGPS